MVAVLGEIHRGCPLPGQQPACLARLGTGAGACGCGSCPRSAGARLAWRPNPRSPCRSGPGTPPRRPYQSLLDSWHGYTLSALVALGANAVKDKPQAQFGC